MTPSADTPVELTDEQVVLYDEAERDGEFATFCRREGTTAARADSVSGSYRATWNEGWKIGRAALLARIALLEQQIAWHNADMKSRCEMKHMTGSSFAKLCRAYTARGRWCPDCPRDNMIEVDAKGTT